MKKYCTKSCNFCGNDGGDDDDDDELMMVDDDDKDDELCVDLHDNCNFWASKGECEANPDCKKNTRKRKEKRHEYDIALFVFYY